MRHDLETREGALEALEIAKREALDEFRSNKHVRPRAVVFVGKDPAGVPIRDILGRPTYTIAFVFASQVASRQHAAGFGGYLREFIESSAACGVISIFEMWRGEGSDRGKLPKDFSGPFEGRKEGILVSLEHVAFDQTILCWSEITRSAAGKGTAAPYVDAGVIGVGGNFTNLLRRSAS